MLQTTSVAVFALLSLIIGLRTLSRYRNVKVSKSILGPESEVEAYEKMCAALPVSSNGPAPFSDAARGLFQTYTTGLSDMEAKATGILGFVGGGTSIVAVLGTSPDRNLPLTPLLVFAGILLAIVLVCSVLCCTRKYARPQTWPRWRTQEFFPPKTGGPTSTLGWGDNTQRRLANSSPLL